MEGGDEDPFLGGGWVGAGANSFAQQRSESEIHVCDDANTANTALRARSL